MFEMSAGCPVHRDKVQHHLMDYISSAISNKPHLIRFRKSLDQPDLRVCVAEYQLVKKDITLLHLLFYNGPKKGSSYIMIHCQCHREQFCKFRNTLANKNTYFDELQL